MEISLICELSVRFFHHYFIIYVIKKCISTKVLHFFFKFQRLTIVNKQIIIKINNLLKEERCLSPNNMRKDVTPRQQRNTQNNNQEKMVKNKKNNSYFKRFGISLLGGALGGMLVVGGYTVINKEVNPTSTGTSTTQSVADTGKTKVQTTKVNATSDVTEAVENMSDAVVSITTLEKQASQQSELDRLFGNQGSNESSNDGELTESSEGSGVIYRKDGDKAYIVTNNHVVTGADAVQVMLSNGDTVDAKIVGTDTYSDLAVLEIASDKVTKVAEFTNSDDIKVGETVLAMGSPLGSTFSNSVSQGIVSAKDRMISNETDDGQLINSNAIQTDAAINPGNSGGPLVNTSGQIVGINSSKIAQAASGVSAEGMGFAIPSNDVVKIINQLEQGKDVIRPMLGVSMINLSAISTAEKENILKLTDDSITSGVIVGYVQEKSPAEKAGIKKYDVITQLDGQNISSSAELQTILYQKSVGDKLEVTYYREGKKKTATVTLDQDSSKLSAMSQNEESSSQEQDPNQ